MAKPEIQTELDEIIEQIGKARVNGDTVSLLELRQRRNELETEIGEIDAESSYLSKRDAESKHAAHEAAVHLTLTNYETAERRYIDATKKIESSLQRLASLGDALSIQTSSLIDSGNPIQVIQGVWNELEPDVQQGFQARFTDVYRHTKVASSLPETLERLFFHQRMLSSSAGRLKTSVPKSPMKNVGGGVTKVLTPKAKMPAEQPKRTARQLEIPKINRNKPLVPNSTRHVKRPRMSGL